MLNVNKNNHRVKNTQVVRMRDKGTIKDELQVVVNFLKGLTLEPQLNLYFCSLRQQPASLCVQVHRLSLQPVVPLAFVLCGCVVPLLELVVRYRVRNNLGLAVEARGDA